MTLKTKTSRLTREILETAKDMRDSGIISQAKYKKMTMRNTSKTEQAITAKLTAQEIHNLRDRTNMSQAVFARYLNLTPGYISQLERGIKYPTGAALALLNVIKRKGIEVMQ